MKCIFLAIALLWAADSTQTLTQNERDQAVAELEGSKKAFLDATKGLSAVQWNFKPAPERWSVAECSEHIALAEGFIFGLVSERIMKAPANPEKRDAAKGKDEMIVKMMQDRSHKATAPEPIDPAKHGTMTPEETLKLFGESRAHTIEYIKTTQEDLRDHLFDHPVPAIGTLDGYQWIMLISGHTRRHTAQILEVKADPHFPKM
jgi:DinB family protein